MSASQEAWQRLGEMLERRRVELDTRYANLRLFSGERGIDYRLAWDVEHAARTNYRRPTLTSIEVAYALRPGSIRLVLSGGDPVLLDSEAAAQAPPPHPRYSDPSLRRIDEDPDLTREEKDAMIALAVRMRERKSREREALG